MTASTEGRGVCGRKYRPLEETLAITGFVPAPIFHIVQELCESRGGRPGLSVLTSLLVSVDVNLY